MFKNIDKKYILAGIIGILLLYIVVSRYIDFSSDIPSFPSWDEKVDEIVINNSKGKFKIYKKKNKWLINKEAYKAKKSVVDNMKRKLKELKIIEQVSDKAFYHTYGLDKGQYMEIIAKKGAKEIRNIKFGKKSSTQHTYVRVKNKKGVYLAQDVFTMFDKDLDTFRDKIIMKLAKDAITDMQITYRGRTFHFYKEAVKVDKKKKSKVKNKIKKKKQPKFIWKYKGAPQMKLKKGKMTSLVRTFSPLRAMKYPKMKKSDLKFPVATIKVKVYTKEVSIEIFEKLDPKDKKKKRKIYYARSSESPFVFTLSKWNAEKFYIANLKKLQDK